MILILSRNISRMRLDKWFQDKDNFSITHFLENKGEDKGFHKEAWKIYIFLSTIQSKDVDLDLLLKHSSTQIFSDEFVYATSCDIHIFKISYLIVFAVMYRDVFFL